MNMDTNRALNFVSQVTSMRGQLADLPEGDVGILITAKDDKVTCLISGEPTTWQTIGLMEYAMLIQKQMAVTFAEDSDND